jgi:hypothetical protein
MIWYVYNTACDFLMLLVINISFHIDHFLFSLDLQFRRRLEGKLPNTVHDLPDVDYQFQIRFRNSLRLT